MTATAYMGLEKVLKPLVGFREEGELAQKREKPVIQQIDGLLAAAGLTKSWPRPCPSISTTSSASSE
jgi:hypothetical protein